jgi:hypothetical protein
MTTVIGQVELTRQLSLMVTIDQRAAEVNMDESLSATGAPARTLPQHFSGIAAARRAGPP